MADELYKETLEAAKSEMESLLDDEVTLDVQLSTVRSRIEVLRKTIMSIGDLLGEDREPEAIGVTDAIRAALKTKPENYLTPRAVRNALQSASFPVKNYKNLLAVIHTTLKRLEEQGEVEPLVRDNKTYYKWAGLKDEDIPF